MPTIQTDTTALALNTLSDDGRHVVKTVGSNKTWVFNTIPTPSLLNYTSLFNAMPNDVFHNYSNINPGSGLERTLVLFSVPSPGYYLIDIRLRVDNGSNSGGLQRVGFKYFIDGVETFTEYTTFTAANVLPKRTTNFSNIFYIGSNFNIKSSYSITPSLDISNIFYSKLT